VETIPPAEAEVVGLRVLHGPETGGATIAGSGRLPGVEVEIARLIALLDDDSVTVAEDAKAELASLGSVVLAPLAAAVRGLQPYGQLSAIEIFEELAEPAAAPALIGLLASGSSMVREWAAWALHDLGGPDAVVPLNDAYLRHRAEGHDPDHGEAVAHRRALTALGGRAELIPPMTAVLRTGIGNLERVWPVARLVEIIDELAAYGQAVLDTQWHSVRRR
jgi:HEAT repeat protein